MTTSVNPRNRAKKTFRERKKKQKLKREAMSSSLSNDDPQLGQSNRSAEVEGGDGGNYTAYESRFQSQRFDSSFSSFEKDLQGGGDSSPYSNQEDISSPQKELLETQSPPLNHSSDDTNGPILPPPSVMEKEEGFALREWRRYILFSCMQLFALLASSRK